MKGYLVKKVKVGNDQKMPQSERNCHSKNRGGKKQTNNKKTYTCSKPNE